MKKLNLSMLVLFGLLTDSLYAADAGQMGGQLGSFFPLIVIFVIFYFFLIRPQQKKAKEHQQMLNAVKKDDKVLTTGGIYGVVTNVKNDILEVKIAENVKVQVAKSAVSNVIKTESETVLTPEIVK